MVVNLVNIATFFLIGRKHPLQKIFGLRSEMDGCRELDLLRPNNVDLEGVEFVVFGAEGKPSAEHVIEADAKTEEVGFGEVMVLLMEDLLRSVQWAAPIVPSRDDFWMDGRGGQG